MITNKKAYHNYELVEEYECGMVLEGWEAKSLADGIAAIVGSHCVVRDGEMFLVGSSIGKADNDQLRTRKLLLNRSELNRLMGRVQEKGLTLVPLKIYKKHGKFKLAIALAKGKKEYDKREDAKKRDIENEMRRIVKSQKL